MQNKYDLYEGPIDDIYINVNQREIVIVQNNQRIKIRTTDNKYIKVKQLNKNCLVDI